MPSSKYSLSILQGKFRKQKISAAIKIHGHTEATPQKIKEAAFQLIQNRETRSEKIIFCDLFAGSGQMGFEALSRNFFKVFFFEWEKVRLTAIHQWLQAHNVKEQSKVLRIDALKAIKKIFEFQEFAIPSNEEQKKILVIYADPPYNLERQGISAFTILPQEYLKYKQQSNFEKTFLIVQSPSSLYKKLNKNQNFSQKNINFPPDYFSLYQKVYHYNNNVLLTID